MLHSNIETDLGYFKKQHIEFCRGISDNDINNFRSLLNDYDRFEFVYNIPSVHSYEISKISGNKNTEVGLKLKEDGNNAFQSGHYEVALTLYSKSILKLPQENHSDNEQLAVLFANRSAALYHLKEYKLALVDIEIALNNFYPKNLQYKIYDRKARVLLALQQLKSAREVFRTTLTALDEAKLPTDRRQKWQRDVQIMLAMLDKNKDLKDASLVVSSELPKLSNGPNPHYKALSALIDIESSEKMGRYCVAKQNIKPGEVLVKEDPYSAVLLSEYAGTHCFHCFKRCVSPQPCPQCCNVLFCSITCQEAATATHHKYECCVLPALWTSGASITCLIALRIISQSDISYFLNVKPHLQEDVKLYKSNDYRTLYNLVRHEKERSAEDFLHRTHMAVFLLRCLQSASYFKDFNQSGSSFGVVPLTEDEKYIGSLLLRHLQILQFNAHEISELLIDKKTGSSNSVFVGGAVYPSLALFNHSCNPGIVRYHHGTTVIVHSIRNAKEGDMIAENYGPIFTQTSRNERQDKLKSQYWFDCTCEACEQDWPTFDKMEESSTMRFRCETALCDNVILVPTDTMEFMVQCSKCKKYTNILKGLKALQDTDAMFRIGNNLLESGDISKALPNFLKILSLLDDNLVPPYKDYHLCQQAIRSCLLQLGNKYSNQ